MGQASRQEEYDFEVMYTGQQNLASEGQFRQLSDRELLYQSEGRGEHQRSSRYGEPSGSRQRTDIQESGSRQRNPYLVNYAEQNRRSQTASRTSRKEIDLIWGEEIELPIIPARSKKRLEEREIETSARQGEVRRHKEERIQRPDRKQAKDHSMSKQLRPQEAKRMHEQRRREAVQEGPRREGTQRVTNQSASKRRRVSGAVQNYQGMANSSEGVLRTAPPKTIKKPPTRTVVRNSKQQRRRAELIRKRLILGAVEGVILLCLCVLLYVTFHKPKEEVTSPDINQQETIVTPQVKNEKVQGFSKEVFDTHPEWTEDFLTISEYSRPGEPLPEVKNIFVHYTANPNTSAAQNRSYFEQLKDTHERGASAHFIIGYDGEILQCVPLDEVAYAVQTRNEDSISIECCFKNKDGSFTQETYDSLIKLLAWLTEAYGLDSEDILRHYDCGGKKCPIYYTENEDAWERLKADVRDYKA